MLLHVSNGAYIEGSLMAAKFIVHVEALFSAIDQLDELSVRAAGQGRYFTFATDGRPRISKRSKATLSENSQLLFPSK
jgi:hypothetical protein